MWKCLGLEKRHHHTQVDPTTLDSGGPEQAMQVLPVQPGPRAFALKAPFPELSQPHTSTSLLFLSMPQTLSL